MTQEKTTSIIHLCLDLNIWYSALLADRLDRQGTATQSLVEIAKQGVCSLGQVQLVISWGMLNRLRLALQRDSSIPQSAIDLYISAIGGYAQLGPAGGGPQLSLGGTGIISLQDSEDAHVLETALAGRATVLVTANFEDFISKDTNIIVPRRHAIHFFPAHAFHIAHPYLMMEWIRAGQIPSLT
jgi:predicted nucleic acid-binding protein